MSAEWELEFEQALMTALQGASALTALLASSTAIYAERPFDDGAFPQLTYVYRDESPQNLSGPETVNLALQIDIWAEAGSVAAIRKALQDVLDDRRRIADGSAVSPVTMTNWTCKHIRYLRGHALPTRRFVADTTQRELIQGVTEWSVRLYRT